jgi:crotonobetainyl-CoA:carnitine CoA-transferase CaiB-like acyl-CoA transferase
LKTDERFADRQSRKRHRNELNVEIEQALSARSAAEWDTMMIAAGVPAGQVLSIPQVLRHEHIAARGFVKRFDGEQGAQQVTTAGFRMSDGVPEPKTPAPTLSADTEAWLAHLGYHSDAIEALRTEGVI